MSMWYFWSTQIQISGNAPLYPLELNIETTILPGVENSICRQGLSAPRLDFCCLVTLGRAGTSCKQNQHTCKRLGGAQCAHLPDAPKVCNRHSRQQSNDENALGESGIKQCENARQPANLLCAIRSAKQAHELPCSSSCLCSSTTGPGARPASSPSALSSIYGIPAHATPLPADLETQLQIPAAISLLSLTANRDAQIGWRLCKQRALGSGECCTPTGRVLLSLATGGKEKVGNSDVIQRNLTREASPS